MTGPPSVAPRAPSAAHSKAALASDGDGPRLVQAKQALRTAQCARNDAVHLLRGTYVGVRADTEAADRCGSPPAGGTEWTRQQAFELHRRRAIDVNRCAMVVTRLNASPARRKITAEKARKRYAQGNGALRKKMMRHAAAQGRVGRIGVSPRSLS